MWLMLMKYLEDWKIPATLAVAILVGLFSMYLWAVGAFVSKAQAAQDLQSLSKKIEANGHLIAGLEDSIDLNEVRRDIKTTRNQQYSLSVQIAQAGETSLSDQRRVELDNDMIDLEKLEICLVLGKASC